MGAVIEVKKCKFTEVVEIFNTDNAIYVYLKMYESANEYSVQVYITKGGILNVIVYEDTEVEVGVFHHELTIGLSQHICDFGSVQCSFYFCERFTAIVYAIVCIDKNLKESLDKSNLILSYKLGD